MKKILFVLDALHSGGAEKSLSSLLSLFDYDKYHVDMLIFKPGGLYSPLIPKEVNRLESPQVFIDMRTSLKDLAKQGKFSSLIWRMKSSIKLRYNMKFTNINHGAQALWPSLDSRLEKLEKEYDVAIAYSQGTPTYYVADKVKAKKKLAWVNIDYKIAGYNKDFDINYYRKFDNIINVSEACTKVFNEVYPEFEYKVKTIYDIISESLINNMSVAGKGFIDNFDGVRILTIGRLAYQKGYDMAIEAAKILKDKNIKFKWHVIGEGNLKDELRELVKNNGLEKDFIFMGTFVNPYPFIKQCDIYCQPSRFEGFGLAIAEARLLNKPVVATNFEIVHDQITNKVNGVISDMNSQSIAKSLIELIDDKDLSYRIIENLKDEKGGTEEEINKIYELIEGRG